MTVNLWNEQRDLICLNCARRIVAPRRTSSKYSPLREYLWRRGQFTSLVTLTFSKIEGIINNNLPFGALRSEEWWNNNEITSQGYAWTSAGWKVQSVDLKERTVTFRKLISEERSPMLRRRRRKTKTSQKAFIPVPIKPWKPKRPSKTRIARAVARARNVERRKAALYKIKLKPKYAYEKKLYKPEAKPSAQN
ncbi:MAG: hypothetical protein ACE5KD_02505 [Candidatus Bathyarchaeia archaeon]